MSHWSDAEIARAIREGKSRDGSPLKPPMAFGWYKNINDDANRVSRVTVIFNNSYQDQGQRNATTLSRLLSATDAGR